MQHETSDIWRAAIPLPGAIESLRKKLNLVRNGRDVFLAYSASMRIQFAGYLVTYNQSLNQLLAFCPVSSDLCVASAPWFTEVSRQLDTALSVMQGNEQSTRASDLIWLQNRVAETGEIPAWIYSLACAPLTFRWDGMYRYPRPFCPKLFETLAQQPEAAVWLRTQMSRDLPATAI